MIATNTAFEFLREHKEVKAEVENLVMKKVRGRFTQNELLTIFEDGISGKYGKVYTLDAQTLLDWISKAQAAKSKSSTFVDGNLLDPNTPVSSTRYPTKPVEWNREANKAYTAYLSGNDGWHPHLYHHLVMDGKIALKSMQKYTPKEYPLCPPAEIDKAMKLAVKDFFSGCKSKGYNFIYHQSLCE